MAASKEVYKALLERDVECSLCRGVLTNPKMLNCSHTFCKTCIEDIVLKFRPDKTAVVRCSFCEEETVIEKDKTVNDLRRAPNQLMNVINRVNKVQNTKQVQHRCFNTPDCEKIACYYCKFCHKKMCEVCKPKHSHGKVNDGMGFVFFKSNEKDPDEIPEILPWCNDHSTYARYKYEKGYICIYCKERSDAKHNFQKIDVLHEEIRKRVMNHHPQIENLEDLVEKCRVRSKVEVENIKDILINEIRIRKKLSLERYIEKYIEKLNCEEDELLKDFDKLINKHFERYPSTSPTDYVSEKRKAKFEVLEEEETIFAKVNNITAEKVRVPHLSIQYPGVSMTTEKQLGTLYGVDLPVVLSESTVTVCHGITDYSKFSLEYLNVLLEELHMRVDRTKAVDVLKVKKRDDGEYGGKMLLPQLKPPCSIK